MNYEDKTNRWIAIEVAKRLGKRVATVTEFHEGDGCVVYPHSNRINFDPCSSPSDAWPIIVDNCISLTTIGDGNWHADTVESIDCTDSNHFTCTSSNHFHDDNPLRAAMICFLKMKDAENGN